MLKPLLLEHAVKVKQQNNTEISFFTLTPKKSPTVPLGFCLMRF